MRNFITSMVATTIYYTQDTGPTAIQLVFICIFREKNYNEETKFFKTTTCFELRMSI